MEMTTKKKYELRPLTASDMSAVCKIMKGIGIREFKECFKIDPTQDKMNEIQIGVNVMFDVAGIIIANMPKCESDIQTFLSSLTGITVEDIQKLPFVEYTELIVEVVTKEEFKDFFKVVMKLFNL